MKYKNFIFSDLHGCIDDLLFSLKNSGFNEEDNTHRLIFLGDAFGHNSFGHYKTYQFLKKMIEKKKLIWVKGNHELYLINALDRANPSKFTQDTIKDIAIGFDNNVDKYNDLDCLKLVKNYNLDSFIKENVINYFETKNHVFVHGFIPYLKKENKYDPLWREANESRWNSACSTNGMKMVINGMKIQNKTIVCGHIGAYFGNILKMYPDIKLDSKEFKKIGNSIKNNASKNPEPFKTYYGDGVIGIDTRSYDTHQFNILIIEEEDIDE